jgi:hypothetical protein
VLLHMDFVFGDDLPTSAIPSDDEWVAQGSGPAYVDVVALTLTVNDTWWPKIHTSRNLK